MRTKILTISIALALCFAPMMAGTGTAKPFYQGKTIKIIVGYKPGGGYDFYGRLMARYMKKYLPGSNIIVKNMPGAGSIIACNTLSVSKPEGLTFGSFDRSLPLAQVAGLKGVKYDLAKMSWLGSTATDTFTFVMSTKGPFKNLKDTMKAKEVIIGTQGYGSTGHVVPSLFKKMAGIKNYTLSPGYPGTAAVAMAMMQGEVHGEFASWSSIRAFVQDGNAFPVMFVSEKPVKGYDNVPVIGDIVKDKKYQPMINVLVSISMLARPYVGPPDIPKDRLKILRNAFENRAR